MWGVFVMMLMVVVDITMRALMGRSLLFAEEVGGYLLVLVAYLAMAEALKQGRHIRVEFLRKWIPTRLQRKLDLILTVPALCALIVLLWRSIIMVYRSYIRGTKIPGVLLTPVYLPQIVLVIGLVALTLQCAVQLHKMIHDLRNSRKELDS